MGSTCRFAPGSGQDLSSWVQATGSQGFYLSRLPAPLLGHRPYPCVAGGGTHGVHRDFGGLRECWLPRGLKCIVDRADNIVI